MRAVLGTRTRRWSVLALAVVIVAAAVAVFWPRDPATPIATEDLTIAGAAAPWDDRPVQLDATLYLPADVPAPAVIVAHGFGGSKDSVAADAENLARAGFVALAYSARGFGASTGTISLDSLDAEVPDAGKLVDYLAGRPEVRQDAVGDPRVGVTGGSYGGALSLMLAGTDQRIDAVVPVITWNNLQQALFPNALEGDDPPASGTPAGTAAAGDGVFKKYWAAALISSVVAGADLSPGAAVDVGPAAGERGGNRSAPPSGDQQPPGPGDGSGSGSSDQPASSSGDPGCGRLRLAVCAAYAQAAATGRINDAMRALLARSSPAAVTGDISAPTLLVQGELDTLFPLNQADANARQIAAAGTTVAVDWYRGGHDGGAPDPATRDRITDWFRYYLSGVGTAPSTAFRYSVDGGLTDSGRPRTRVLQAEHYPGIGGATPVDRREIALSGDDQVLLNPPGGSPAAISSLPGLGRAAGALTSALSSALPGQSATFTSKPFDRLAVVTGSARVSLSLSSLQTATGATGADDSGSDSGSGAGQENGSDSGPVLFASIGTISDGGLTTMGGNAVSPVRLPPLPARGSPTTVTVDLPAVSLQVSQGDRLIVRFATTDQAYAGPTQAAAYRISGVNSVSIPEAGGVRVSAGEVPIGVLVALIALAIAAVIALLAAGRIRHSGRRAAARAEARRPSDPGAAGPPDPAPEAGPAPPPLVIRGLAKSYPGGVQAVQDVSFAVEAGSVLGLLGPNGAGKTTTLRMVMGLIEPTAGSIEVFGRPVSPGAEILSRIGSFVEGAGFLPHLSGRSNLRLYWQATGRPAADSHLAEALEIAGLGTAIDRRVKTYSQGMRQRLAIAQAMLGLPDLLLLDEPTNGLDPPQIHAMREVLRRYAATGRTVLVSSHLLSEVEQTCRDVVVIHRGLTIAAGRVADLVSSSGEMSFVVDEPASAVDVLGRLDGVTEVEIVADAVQVDLGTVPAATAISALVAAGVAVSSAAPRNRLEDVFLDLVGATGGATTGGAESVAAGTGNGAS